MAPLRHRSESVVKELNLGEWSRYGFSGGLFLIVFLLAHPTWSCYLWSSTGGAAILAGTALLFSTLVFGSLIYAIHRAVLYRLLFALALLCLCRRKVYEYESAIRVYEWQCDIVKPLVPSKIELAIDDWRASLRGTTDKDPIFRFVDGWATQVHLLYCSAWAVLFGMFLGRSPSWALPNCERIARNGLFFGIAAVLVLGLSGFYHDLRLLRRIRRELRWRL
jgi:hypothetical protein